MAASVSNLVRYGERHVTAGITRIANSVIAKGQGSYLHMEDGRKLLDFTSGIGVTGLGEISSEILRRFEI